MNTQDDTYKVIAEYFRKENERLDEEIARRKRVMEQEFGPTPYWNFMNSLLRS